MNSEKTISAEAHADEQLKKLLAESRRRPAQNPWFEQRVMAALPDKKERRIPALQLALSVCAILIVAGGWIAGGGWFLNHDLTLSSLAVVCSIPLTTMFSGAVVAAPALKRLFS